MGNLVLYARFGENRQLNTTHAITNSNPDHKSVFMNFFWSKRNDIRQLEKIRSIAKWDEKKGSNIIIISKTSFLLLSTIKEGHKKVDY